MSTAPRSPLQPPRQERRALLSRHFVDVVEPLVAGGERYADLSVERLIKAAGISRSAFYTYFDDKGDLLSAMAQDVIEDLFVAGRSWWTLPLQADRADLREALRPAVETFRAHYTILGAVIEASVADPRASEQYTRLIDEVTASLAEHIAAAQAAGRAAPELDPERTARWLILMHERGMYHLFSPAPHDEAERLLGALTDIVWRALYAGFREDGTAASS